MVIDVTSLQEIQGEDESHVYAGVKKDKKTQGLLGAVKGSGGTSTYNAAPEAFELSGSAGFLKKRKKGDSEIKV